MLYEVITDMISNVLSVFKTQFENETEELQQVGRELINVQNASNILVENANNSKEVMNILVQKSGDLKSLADGFEVVFNNRGVKRTIITPPIHAHIRNGSKTEEPGVYLFDNSEKGISFYAAEDALSFKLNKGDTGELQP